METTRIEVNVDLAKDPQTVFDALITPSAIRRWWSASRAIVHAAEGGLWMAAWGVQEDQPDYVCGYRLSTFEPPHRLVFSDPIYHARQGDMPDSLGQVTIEFSIRPIDDGSSLIVSQTGIPATEMEFCEGCKTGWKTTLDQLQQFLS